MTSKIFPILGLTLILANFALSQDYIQIEHLGPQYMQVQTLFVTQDKIPDTSLFRTVVVLDHSKYSVFKSLIYRYLPKNNKRKATDFGCFELKINDSNKLGIYYIHPRETSIKYFKNILSLVTKDNLSDALARQFDVYIKQITY